MQPFDKHQANTGELEQCGASLLGTIGQSIANGHTTDGAYRPAIGNWTGMCAPEIAAAPGPFHQGAAQTRAALAWAAVVTRYWASQVTAFNARVDAIVSDLNAQGPHYGATGSNGDPPSQSDVDAARQAKEAQARRQWWEAHNTYVVDGGARAASMLQQGPTEQNLRAVTDAGALDAGPGWNPLPMMWTAFSRNVIPPGGELGLLGVGLWGAGRGLAGLGAASTWNEYARLGVYVRGHWRRTPSGGRIWIDPYWRARPGQVAARTRWTSIGRWGGRAGTVLTVGTSALNQWAADSGRTDMGTGERVARAGTRGAIVGGSAWAGAAVGAKGGALAGAAIGSVIPVVGTGVGAAVGGIVGGVAGGVIGSGVGNVIADHAVEAVDEVGRGISRGASWVGDRASDAGDWAGDRLSDAGDALEDVGSALNPFD